MVALLLLIIPLPEQQPAEVELVEWNWICPGNRHQVIVWRHVHGNSRKWEVAQWEWIDPESVHLSRRFEDGYRLFHAKVLNGMGHPEGWILIKTRSFIKTAGIDREIQNRQYLHTVDRQPYPLEIRRNDLYLPK